MFININTHVAATGSADEKNPGIINFFALFRKSSASFIFSTFCSGLSDDFRLIFPDQFDAALDVFIVEEETVGLDEGLFPDVPAVLLGFDGAGAPAAPPNRAAFVASTLL